MNEAWIVYTDKSGKMRTCIIFEWLTGDHTYEQINGCVQEFISLFTEHGNTDVHGQIWWADKAGGGVEYVH